MIVYKIVSEDLWREMAGGSSLAGAPVDHESGFIHFSTARQTPETAARHFSGQTGLLLVAVEADLLGPALKWEPSRGGDLFPHLYGPLPTSAVRKVAPIPVDDFGRHVFDGLLE